MTPREAEQPKKVTTTMRVAVHPIKAKLWKVRGQINPDMSLRQLASLIGLPKANPQQIRHHLETMVKMGTIDYIGGRFVFPKD